MTRPDPKHVDRLFERALDLDEDERAAFVDRECGSDEELKRQLVELIAAAESSDDAVDGRFSQIRDRLLERVLGGSADGVDAEEDLSGQRIGHWRLERRIARGGLATVYLAHRDDGNYDQRAAFKVLRRGLDTDDLIARFRAERQILSALDHPAIAGILDGGALEDGRPYLVLEFVDGVPITQYCNENDVSVRGRVRLMLEVLRALHHAHRHLIVHRDIKPSNILVTKDGHVALLDFGIAKLLDPGALPGASTMTRTGMSLLTPGYCSPEQHAGEAVTTASDVYQAGAVLFELLTGQRPRIHVRDPGDLDAPPPSRSLRGRPVFREVAGDLDAIVGKAMRGDPAERYASADDMEADLKRYLDGRPVLARPDTFRYRLVKFNRRYRWALPVALAAAVGVGAYVYTLNSYNEQLRIEQQRAAAAQAFLVDILSSPDPFYPADADIGRNISVVEALDIGIERLRSDTDMDSSLKASLLASISNVLASLDEHERAVDLRREALDLERAVYGEPSPPVLKSLQLLAAEYRTLGDYEAASAYAETQLEAARLLHESDHPAGGEAEAIAARLASAIGDFERAKSLYTSAVNRMRNAPVDYSGPLIEALIALSDFHRADDDGLAMALVGEARDLAEKFFGKDSVSLALVMSQAATIHSTAGRFDESEKAFRIALSIYEKQLGRSHGATLTTLNNLALLYTRAANYDRAEPLYREVLNAYLAKFGPVHRTVADSYQNLATAITRSGRYDESIPMHQAAFDVYRAVLPKDQPVVAFPLMSKAYAENLAGRHEDAESTARAALDILYSTAEDSYYVGVAECLLGRALERQGNFAAGKEFLDRSHERLIGSAVSDTYRNYCEVPAI